MSKRISPAFAAIVIIVVLLIGGLYFMFQYRSAERRFAAEREAGRRSVERLQATGELGRMQNTKMEARDAARPGGSPPAGEAAPAASPAEE